MRTPDECRQKAAGLEEQAETATSDARRRAYLELAGQWRRLADRYENRVHDDPEVLRRRWPPRRPPLN